MNKPVTLMVMAPGKGNRRLVLTPTLMWAGLALLLMLFGVGVWGAVAVYQLQTDARQYKDDYASLRLEHQELAANYADLESQLRDIEALSSDVRHVLGLNKSPSFQAPLDGQGGGEELTLDETNTVRDLTFVTADNEYVDAIPIADESFDRADRLLRSLEEIRTVTIDDMSNIATMPTILPMEQGAKYWYSSSFGMRKSPFTGRREFHSGLDIATREGTPVLAPADGVVIDLFNNAFIGNAIKIRHSGRYETVYGHLRRNNPYFGELKEGMEVKRGDVIGYVGSTGRATASHLHYEVRENGERVNPRYYILER